MTIGGALSDLNNLLKADDIPFYYKPSIKAVMDTIKLSSYENPKMGRWIDTDDSKSECSICGHREFNERFLFEDINFCAKCGAKMVEPQESEV